MKKAVADIACLFSELGDAKDSTGSLQVLGDLLASWRPLQLLFLDDMGNVLAEEHFGRGMDPDRIVPFSSMIFDHLGEKTFCHFSLHALSEVHDAFAVRLLLEDDAVILGGLFPQEALQDQDIQYVQAALTFGGKLAWIAFHAATQAVELQTRIRHLLAEGVALKASHSEAINEAVQEHEERIREHLRYDARLNSVLRAAADGILVTNEEGIIETCNPAAEQIFGYHAQEMIGTCIMILIPTLGMETNEGNALPQWKISPDIATRARREVDGVRKGGALCPLELAISSTWVDDECIFTIIVRDVTERRKTEQEHHRLYLQNQMILNSAGEGIFGTDLEGRIIFANPAAAKMLGALPEELIGQSAYDMFHLMQRDGTPCSREENPLQKTIQDGQFRRWNNKLFWRRDGSSFPVRSTCTPIREGNEILGAVVTFADITERRLLEAQLTQAQKLESIGQLAAGIAHEINTPTQYIGDNTRFLRDTFEELRPILLSCKNLKAVYESSDAVSLPAEIIESLHRNDIEYLLQEIPSAIEQSLEGVERVSKIVRSMKEFSHPGGDVKQAIDLNRAIESTLMVARNEWKYVAELELDLAPDLPPVTCLPGDLNQVFLNLIVNAAQSMEAKLGASPQEKGTLTMRTRREGDVVAIQVQDTGTGIPPNICHRIYDPFFTSKNVGEGTGQGLAITRNIVVDRHGGAISFETEPGQGTTFTIRIPILPPPNNGKGEYREETYSLRGR